MPRITSSQSFVASLVTIIIVFRRCEGGLDCLCTTPECRDRHDIVCTTDSMCYVQYIPLGLEAAPRGDPQDPTLVRGCIDSHTPLLCENQRPKFYKGPWPVMFCCNSHLCNKDAVPTLPPWVGVQAITEKTESEQSPPEGSSNTENSPNEIDGNDPGGETQTTRKRRLYINPLYVGVPVAGACVLLAIIIFAVYILRRQSQMYEEEYLRAQAKRRPPCPEGCRYITMVTRTGQPLTRCQNGCVYATDSDGSSNGSESRLLAKV